MDEPPGPAAPREPTAWLAGLDRAWAALPASVTVLVAPVILRATGSVYDAGLTLTLARFLSPDRLPYRDLWTLYGPGPPILGSFVMGLFGPGLGPLRIVLVLLHAATALLVYLIARRFVPRWAAATLAAFAGAVASPIHFHQTVLILLWGWWLILRAREDPARAPRRLVATSLLFGLSFWGRFEFAPIGALLVVGLWLAVRRRLGPRRAGRVLLVGLVPPAGFLVYLIAVVGVDRAWLNLVEYPFFRYAAEACRGLPDAWPNALHALAAPLRGRLWSAVGLVLWTATFLPPVLGGLCLLVARARRADPPAAFVAAAIGAITLFVWVEHRPRASLSPGPLVPLMAVCVAVLLASLARRRPRSSRWTGAGVAAVIGVTLVTSTVPVAVRAWSDWPPYDARLGWEGGRFEGLYDEAVWSRVAAEVRGRTEPGEEIFVALTENRRHHANAPVFYWFVDRPPASRFIEFNPCLTDTSAVQRLIVADLGAVDVVIATTFFPDLRRSPTEGPTVLDEYLAARFSPVFRGDLPQGQAVLVLERND